MSLVNKLKVNLSKRHFHIRNSPKVIREQNQHNMLKVFKEQHKVQSSKRNISKQIIKIKQNTPERVKNYTRINNDTSKCA